MSDTAHHIRSDAATFDVDADVVTIADEGLGNHAYVVRVDDAEAVVVDPSRDPRPYLAAATARGWTIRAAIETHVHADFVSGSRELAAAAGAEVWVPGLDGLDLPEPGFATRWLADGDAVAVGGLRLEALATPGHTPEHLAYVLRDAAGAALAVFSGGTLIAGGVARPDLLGGSWTEPLARAAHRSIHQRLLALPDDTPLLPTHGPGSFCSAGPGGGHTSTVGEQRATHPLVGHDEDAFVAALLGGLGTYPPYFRELRPVNAAGPRVHGDQPALPPQLSPDEVAAAGSGGAELVDVRPVERFAAAHVPGAVSIALRASFAVWLGWLVGRDRELILAVDGDTDVDRAVSEARKVGVERLAGVIDVAAWRDAGRPTASLAMLDPAAAAASQRRLVDVRQAGEWAAGHVPGAAHVELGALADHEEADTSAVPAGAVAVHCGHGERAVTAASLLARRGHDAAAVAGGPGELVAAGGQALEGPA